MSEQTVEPEVKRYDAVFDYDDCYVGILPKSHGRYVRYDDYLAIVAERDEPPTGALAQWVASLREGDTLTVYDIHRFVRVELALRNADKHHQQARAMTAELDKAVKALPPDDAERFICLAHPHNNRWEEALCSAKYQLDAAVRERDAYMVNYKNAVRFMESVRGGTLK